MSGLPDSSLTSIVMTTHGIGPRLELAMAAALAQTAPVEVVVVNNGDSPEIGARLAALADKESRLKIIDARDVVGVAASKNRGAREAKGSYLLFLHPEAVLPPTAAERFSKLAAKAKEPFMLGARLVDEQGVERPTSRRTFLTPLVAFVEGLGLASLLPNFRLSRAEESLPSKVATVPVISGACMFLSVKTFFSLKGFDVRCLRAVDDMDFCLRFHRAEGKIYFLSDVVVETARDEGRSDDLTEEEKKAQSLAHYFHENFGYAYPQPVLWLLDAIIWARLIPMLIRRYLEGKKAK